MTVQVLGNAALTAGANQFARLLDDSGVPVRGTVALLCSNRPEYMVAYRGTTWSGRRYTPMSWRWSADDVDYVVGNCAADALVVEHRFADLVESAAERVPAERRFVIGGALDGFRPWGDVEACSAEPYPRPMAGTNMAYTSGTTGRPKGVYRQPPDGPPPGVMGRGGREMLLRCLGGDPHTAADGTHLVTTPLYHSGPMAYADGAALLGADLVLSDRFDAEQALAAIERHRVTSTFMVPTQFVRLLRLPEATRRRYDLGSLGLVVHGSAPVAPDVKRAMIDWLGPILYEFYGGSEGGGVSIDSPDWLAHPGSVGKPGGRMSVEIRDQAGRALPAGSEGQIWFGNLDRFEYKDDPDKTAEAWDGDHFTLGDIGYLDDEGYLYLCDRRADVIISGGVNVYPAQIEAVLLAHPAVADCCVVGVPDDEWGEVVRAVVQPVPGVAADAALITRLDEHCRAALGGAQRPRQIDFDADLPRTETGKLARRTIRDRYWAGRTRRI